MAKSALKSYNGCTSADFMLLVIYCSLSLTRRMKRLLLNVLIREDATAEVSAKAALSPQLF